MAMIIKNDVYDIKFEAIHQFLKFMHHFSYNFFIFVLNTINNPKIT